MVHVVAPDGWLPPVDATKPFVEGNADSSESDFEDIDQILQQKPDKHNAAKRKKKPQGASPSTPKPRSNSTAKPGAAKSAAAPILPDENWTNQSTQRRRNFVLIFAAIAAVVLLGGAIILAINANRNSNSQVADGDRDEVPPPLTTAIGATDLPEATDDPAEKTAPNETGVKESDQNPVVDDSKDASANTNVSESVKTSDQVNEPKDQSDLNVPSSDTDADQLTNQVPTADDPTEQSQANAKSNSFRADLDDFLQPLNSDLANVKTNFDALSAALENQGSSLFDINQWAAINANRRRIGRVKYFIEKPRELSNESADALQEPVLGIQLKDHTFLEFLAEVTQITGTAISFDTDNDFFDEFNFGLSLSNYKQINTTYVGIIESVLKGVSKDFEIDFNREGGALLVVADPQSLQSVVLDLPNSNDRTSEKFVELAKQLIAPDSWNAEENRTAAVNGAKVTISHYPSVISQFRQLISKWNLALEAKSTQGSFDNLRTRWAKSEPARKTKINLELDRAMPILAVAAEIQQRSGINVLVHFNSISTSGWNPLTLMPADLNEPTIEQLLDEITHSMNLSYRCVNDDTFELVSAERLEEITEVELHPCGDILSGQLNASQITEILRQSLQTAGRLDGSCRAYLDNEIECFVVVGSQSVQRLIESVLQRLRDL